MELHISPHRLRIASILKKDIDLFTHSLIKLSLLHQQVSCNFFSFTETCDDFSLITDQEGLKELPSRAELMVQSTVWLALDAIPSFVDADSNSGLTMTTKSIITSLADKNISVYNLSTYQTDFILVKEDEYDDVVTCLSKDFKILKESQDGEMIPIVSQEVDKNSRRNTCGLHTPRPVVHSFHSPDNRFLVTCLQPEQLSHLTSTLLKLMFYSNSFLPSPEDGHERFLSLSIISQKISLVVDVESIALFPSGSLCTGAEEFWRMIKIGNLPLGFDESGIVAQISEPLAEAGIPIYYISTFLNDHTLVSEADIERAFAILESKRGKMIDGNSCEPEDSLHFSIR
ncbi:cytosolic arginine sensor for mTORC1 subunit 2-like [Asterias rubens]|uniref:cytosolic arginine sensor for mTORC1 subunit 2-like n=1 Tax=Asterias rubens TaxID=7604 RepID=UPI00145559A3|nr:cytosolic arginine sensor for mTORC1 subunit 2-like [Asterias rubens]XP_033627000.1 cytosolic arginine sensor for mTORC1 subunit 2-like [Asterias rubens]